MRVAIAACAAGAVLLVAGCGGEQKEGPPPRPSPPTDDQLLRGLVQRRAKALEDGRARVLAATAVAARSRAERAAARSVRALKLTRAHYIVDRVRVRGPRARLSVRLSYGIRGLRGDFGSPRTLLARKQRGTWRIERAEGSRGAEPWEVDDYLRRTTPHFVVWTPRGIEPPLDTLEDGYDRMREVLHRGRLARRYLIVVARDDSHARRMTTSISGLESLTALANTQVRVTGGAERVAEVGTQRVIIIYSQFSIIDPVRQQSVVTHELTHAALAPVTSGRVPGWLVEGVALYVSDDDRRLEYDFRPVVPTLQALSAPDAIGRASGDAQTAAYATASAAAFTIAEHYGRERLLDLLEVFSRSSLRGRRGDPRLADRATRRVLGVTMDGLQKRMRR